ncbi:hypothetical protein [Altererythrobacter sp. MF3-039]|uniref:hypothetical protein n=1 Tax=Altererythrobacter sp. MF3-039 TaxID=3252901 RepID=UPI00390C4A38
MMPLLEIYWPYLLVAFAIGLALAWFLFAASRKTRVTSDTRDVLDEGAVPAARNQALIDSNREANTLTDAANSQKVAHANAQTDAEAGPAITPSRPAAPAGGDDLTRIKGVGPKIVEMLAGQGVNRFEQIAAWDDADIDRIDAQLGRFQGRIRRDNWVEQAKLLAEGDKTAFDAKFGNS